MVKSVSPYALMDSSLFLCGLLSQSVMGQLKVSIAKLVLSAIYYVSRKHNYVFGNCQNEWSFVAAVSTTSCTNHCLLSAYCVLELYIIYKIAQKDTCSLHNKYVN